MEMWMSRDEGRGPGVRYEAGGVKYEEGGVREVG